MGRKSQDSRKNKKKVRRSRCLRGVFAGFLLVFLVGAVMAGVMVGVREKARSEKEKSVVSMPLITIQLAGTTLDEINGGSKETEYLGNTLVLEMDGGEQVYEDVNLRGRGNFSWAADKKSYRIKFKNKVDLLGLGKKRKWALIANSLDDSLMRNDLAYYLADLLGNDYPLRGEFVHLIIDEEDLGVYYLVSTMEIDKWAVNLKNPDGVLVEVDNAYCGDGEGWYKVRNGDCLSVKEVVAEDEVDVAMGDFVDNYNKFLKALSKKDYEKVEQVVDVESFAEYFVLSEFTANPDAYVTSWFLYKDGFDDKIHAGLAWDFDAAFGNTNWGDWPADFYTPTVDLARFRYTFLPNETAFCGVSKNAATKGTVNISWVMCDFLEMPEFRGKVSEVYLEKLATKQDEVLGYIERKADEIRKEAIYDAEIWGKGDFNEAVEYLRDWVEKRFEFFEETYVVRRFNLQKAKREL